MIERSLGEASEIYGAWLGRWKRQIFKGAQWIILEEHFKASYRHYGISHSSSYWFSHYWRTIMSRYIDRGQEPFYDSISWQICLRNLLKGFPNVRIKNINAGRNCCSEQSNQSSVALQAISTCPQRLQRSPRFLTQYLDGTYSTSLLLSVSYCQAQVA